MRSSRNRWTREMVLALVAAVTMIAGSRPAAAQPEATPCDYARFSVSIVPRLTALDVVRGDAETRVASLAFLWPRDPSPAFRGVPAAEQHARHAFGTRRIGAILTTAGLALATTGAVHVAGWPTARRGWFGASYLGLGVVALSVPVHFGADAELSRAAREYNRSLSATSLACPRP